MSRQNIQFTSYGIRILEYHHIFDDTLRVYSGAVRYLVHLIIKEWDSIKNLPPRVGQRFVETTIHATKYNPSPKYDFDKQFYKLPSYIRRAAIEDAIGKVSSYQTHLEKWERSDPHKRGRKPGVPTVKVSFPALYKKNTFMWVDDYTAKIKAYVCNTWDFVTVKLRKSDVNYFNLHNDPDLQGCPKLERNGKRWLLRFPFKHNIRLNQKKIDEELVLGVDLGINNACVCTAMKSDGTIQGRRFLHLPRETDRLDHHIGLIKKAQQHGSHNPKKYWAFVNNINLDIMRKTVSFIMKAATEFGCSRIVMEYLDFQGKKRGSKKQRLHLWKVRKVQKLVTAKAHIYGIRVSTVCARNTSKLAFDGSGEVKRDEDNYSMCTFKTGKRYHADLNASYNIAARYFIRALCESVSEKVRLSISAKVPNCDRRSTCTLSDLRSLYDLVHGVTLIGVSAASAAGA